MSHDQNFKNLILDYPHQALAFFAADEAPDRLVGAEVLPVRQEQLQSRLGERFRELDVPLLVQWPDGRREALLFVLEEETDPQRFSIHRLAHYCLDLGELLKTDRVVPVVIFLRGAAPRRRLVLGGDRHTYLRFRYLACELATLAYERFRDSDNLVARLALPCMRYAPQQRVDAYAQAVRGLASLESDPEKQLKYLDFIDIYADLDDADRARYRCEYPDEAEIMGTFSERFIQQGMEQGMEQGERLGVRKGEAKILLTLLQLKFGEVPALARAAIDAADADTLLRWSQRVLTATRIEEVVADPI
ncbi:MAG TPA: hypothetical protein VES73_05630 [Lamprocystis sp. (in: g-proteobacteria)]|nr:hypothetical protein [Lamprocystis sp. (in: g-proteobacteria)]